MKTVINQETSKERIATAHTNGRSPISPDIALRGEDVESIYEELQNARTTTMLVEGPNDQKALERLGCTNVRQLNGPLYKMVEELEQEDEVIILTDLDSHGRKLYKYFYNELTRRGVRINNRLRVLLFSTPLRQIEGLDSYLRRLEVA